MATITAGAFSGQAQINDRYLAGYPVAPLIPGTVQANDRYLNYPVAQPVLNMNLSAPLPPHKQEFAAKALAQLFPGREVQVKGGLWEYGLSESPLHQGTPVGRFGVRIGSDERIMTVHRWAAPEDLALGHRSFQYFYDAGTEIVNTIPDEHGAIEHAVQAADGDTYYVHFSKLKPGLQWLGLTKDKVDGSDLGSLAGLLTQAAEVMPQDHKRALRRYTASTSDCFHRAGLLALAGAYRSPENAFLFGGQNDLRRKLMPAIERAEDIFNENKRMPGYGGLTEKTVWVGNASDCYDYYLIDSSIPARSSHPVLEGAVSYDAGTAVLRILMNRDLYAGTKAEISTLIAENLKQFVLSYNNSGFHVTADEVLQSAKTVAVLTGAHEVGLYLCGGKNDIYGVEEAQARIRRIFPVMEKQMEQLDSYMGLIPPGPAPDAAPPEPGL